MWLLKWSLLLDKPLITLNGKFLIWIYQETSLARFFYQALSVNTYLLVLAFLSAYLGIEEIKALGSTLPPNYTLTDTHRCCERMLRSSDLNYVFSSAPTLNFQD